MENFDNIKMHGMYVKTAQFNLGCMGPFSTCSAGFSDSVWEYTPEGGQYLSLTLG
jgi:hypothetical protein